MAVQTVTHLNFRGDSRAALTFYQSVFGGEAMVLTYRDADAVQDPAEADQVMWGQVAADSGFRIMAYDVPKRMAWNPGEIPFFVAVRGDTADEIEGYWARLAEVAVIVQPLGPASWSQLYGMLRDRFGVTWVLDVATAAA
jgi:PhnB protein